MHVPGRDCRFPLAAIRLTAEPEATETVPMERIAFVIEKNVKEDLMNRGVFAVLTRRASLMALGAAGLAAFVNPIPTNARDKRKKRKKKRRNGDATNLCKKQVGACASFIRDACERDDGCVGEIDCCSILANCSFSGFVFCFDAASQ